MNETSYPVLYILMRADLPSMNAGKAMAQASHASNAFVHDMLVGKFPDTRANEDNAALYQKWKGETGQGFGTVLVLAVNENEMRSTVSAAHMMGFISGVVHDPTYPIRISPELGIALAFDETPISKVRVGEKPNYVTVPLDTCAYVFGLKDDPILEVIVGKFPLHP